MATSGLDQLDKKILNMIQKDFPIEERPYLEIANRIGNTTEQEVFQRIKTLKETGYIRRLGGIFDTKKLGFKTTLVAAKVDGDKIDQVAKKINSYKGVTHNYKREHNFNLWFTLAAENEQTLNNILSEISSFEGVNRLIKLPAKKLFKIGVNLPMK